MRINQRPSTTASITMSILSSLLFMFPATADADWDDAEKETFERTVSIASGGEVIIRSRNGGIEVSSWDRQEVEIRAEKKAKARTTDEARRLLDAIEIEIDETASGLEIGADLPRTSGREGVSVSFELKVPRDTHVDANTSNGGISLRDLDAAVRAETSNGGISLENIRGNATAETNNGGIKAHDISGTLDASTTNGGIKAEVTADSLRDDMELRTTNGPISLALSPNVAASIDARAHNGSVSSDFEGGHRSHHELELDLNGGGPRIRLRTTNGRIEIDSLR